VHEPEDVVLQSSDVSPASGNISGPHSCVEAHKRAVQIVGCGEATPRLGVHLLEKAPLEWIRHLNSTPSWRPVWRDSIDPEEWREMLDRATMRQNRRAIRS
jgi:hypothetical protein